MKNTEITQVKGHGMIKKTKAYGAVGAIALAGICMMAIDSSGTIYAEEQEPITEGTSVDVIEAEVVSETLDEHKDSAQKEGVEIIEEADVYYDSLEDAKKDIESQQEELENIVQTKAENNAAIEAAEKENADIAKRNEEGKKEADALNTAIEKEKQEIETRNKNAMEEYQKKLEEAELQAMIKENFEAQLGYDLLDTSGDPTASISIDNEGNFTITNTDWVDRADIGGVDRPYGYNIYTGKIDYSLDHPTNQGDITYTVHSVTLNTFSFTYQFDGVVYTYPSIQYSDPNGEVLYYYSKTPGVNVNEIINKTAQLNYTGTLHAGQSSDWIDVLHIFADWVIDSNYKLRIQFINNSTNPVVEEPKLETYEGPDPVTFTPEPFVKVPDVYEAKAKIHKVYVRQNPKALKQVVDAQSKDIDKNTVVKGEETHWILRNDSLKAGRDFIVQYVMKDVLPDGFEVDAAKTAQASKDYEVQYDASANTVQFKAGQALLDKMNEKMNEDLDVPMAVIVGYPLKDAARYPNTFTTTIAMDDAFYDVLTGQIKKGGNKTSYTTQSDEVFILTPDIEARKKDFNTEGVNINGKVVNPGSVNVYKMSWNLSPYKDASISEDTIKKGFFYIDDYPEDAVTINSDEIQVLTPTGKEVDVTVHQFDSIDKADENIKELMKKNNISVNGAFQVFEVKDPQQFYDSYVKTGAILTINNPMTVKQEMKNSGKTYKNKAYQIDFGNGYATNEVVNIVPVVNPVKENLNENNVNIDGLTVAPLSINYYKLHWDLDQYKGMKEVKDAIERGFFYIDDYPEKAVTVLKDQIKIQDEDGNNVSGIKVSFFDSIASASKQVQEMIQSNGFFIEGAFQLFEAENPSDFYEKYVSTGKNIIITNPMQVKEDMVGKYENSSYQIDFGNIGYPSNITVNNVVVPVPVKVNENEEGININGKSILPGGLNFYELTWDLDQYKDMQADKDTIQKGFYFMDDYPEDALEIVKDAITILDARGNKVEGVSYEILSDSSSLPKGLHPKGTYLLFKADDPVSFFEKYVKTGTNIKITAPMKVKKDVKNIDYENTAYQIDFGNAVETDTIINHVPEMDVKKDVVVDMSDESLDGKVIELGKVFSYKLTGALVPKEHSESLWQYLFKDDYDEVHDEYLGKYTMTALTDILMNDGTIIKEGTDLTEYTTQVSDTGIVSISFMKDFLEKISLDSAFQAEALIQMKRIATGEVQNHFTNIVNEAEVISNTVVTYTPQIPVKGVNTAVGFNTGVWSSLAGMAALALGILRRKRS